MPGYGQSLTKLPKVNLATGEPLTPDEIQSGLKRQPNYINLATDLLHGKDGSPDLSVAGTLPKAIDPSTGEEQDYSVYRLPAKVDPAMITHASDALAQAQAIHDVASFAPVNAWGIKHGMRAGPAANGPMMDAISRRILAPLQAEELRVKQQNEANAALNGLNQAGVNAKRQDNSTVLNMAGGFSTAAQAEKARQDEIALRRELAEKQANALTARFANQEYLARLRGQIQAGLIDKRTGTQMEQWLERQSLMEGGFKPRSDAPVGPEAKAYAIANRGLAAGERLAQNIKDHPELLGPAGLHKTWGQVRLAQSPEAQRFAQDLAVVHNALLQDEVRQSTRGGGFALDREALPFIGDDADVAQEGIAHVLAPLRELRDTIAGKYPKFDFEKNAPKEGFSATPIRDARARRPGAAPPPAGPTPPPAEKGLRDRIREKMAAEAAKGQ